MKKNENGRSMIEMLGVLAIIGVLSVGGIYGYTSAMKKYKANEILQTASMLATVARSADGGQGQASMTLAQAGLTTTPGGVSVVMTADGTADPVTVAISCDNSNKTLTQDICDAVTEMAPGYTTTGEGANTVITPSAAANRAGYYISGCTKCS